MDDTMHYEEEITPYKKKSKSKAPKKSNHKHVYEPCVLEYNYPYGKLEEGRGFQVVRRARIDGYCPICGKIGPIDMTPWYRTDANLSVYQHSHGSELSDKAMRELDPITRTLPTFDVGDDWIFPKRVIMNNLTR